MTTLDKNENLDAYERPMRDLRISVTDQCNFRCHYCMPAEIFGPDYAFLPSDKLLSFEEMKRLIEVFVSLGVDKIRITGGEPLLRKGLPDFIKSIEPIKGIKDIALTTNGSLLPKQAKALKEAGLKRVTVSLDSLDEERFQAINGRGYPVRKVLAGIDAAQEAGLEIKLNMVVKKNSNDQDILPMAAYFKEKGHTLRFIEYMDVGNHNGWRMDHVVPSRTILEEIHAEMPLEPIDPNYYGEVAKRYRYKDSKAEIGFVSSVTEAFCSTCTRSRLSAEGALYTCLFATEGHGLRDLMREEHFTDEQMRDHIRGIWKKRTDRYSEERHLLTPELRKKKIEMSHIGG